MNIELIFNAEDGKKRLRLTNVETGFGVELIIDPEMSLARQKIALVAAFATGEREFLKHNTEPR